MAESQDMLALKAKQEAYKKRMMEAGLRAKQDAFKGQMRAAAPPNNPESPLARRVSAAAEANRAKISFASNSQASDRAWEAAAKRNTPAPKVAAGGQLEMNLDGPQRPEARPSLQRPVAPVQGQLGLDTPAQPVRPAPTKQTSFSFDQPNNGAAPKQGTLDLDPRAKPAAQATAQATPQETAKAGTPTPGVKPSKLRTVGSVAGKGLGILGAGLEGKRVYDDVQAADSTAGQVEAVAAGGARLGSAATGAKLAMAAVPKHKAVQAVAGLAGGVGGYMAGEKLTGLRQGAQLGEVWEAATGDGSKDAYSNEQYRAQELEAAGLPSDYNEDIPIIGADDRPLNTAELDAGLNAKKAPLRADAATAKQGIPAEAQAGTDAENEDPSTTPEAQVNKYDVLGNEGLRRKDLNAKTYKEGDQVNFGSFGGVTDGGITGTADANGRMNSFTGRGLQQPQQGGLGGMFGSQSPYASSGNPGGVSDAELAIGRFGRANAIRQQTLDEEAERSGGGRMTVVADPNYKPSLSEMYANRLQASQDKAFGLAQMQADATRDAARIRADGAERAGLARAGGGKQADPYKQYSSMIDAQRKEAEYEEFMANRGLRNRTDQFKQSASELENANAVKTYTQDVITDAYASSNNNAEIPPERLRAIYAGMKSAKGIPVGIGPDGKEIMMRVNELDPLSSDYHDAATKAVHFDNAKNVFRDFLQEHGLKASAVDEPGFFERLSVNTKGGGINQNVVFGAKPYSVAERTMNRLFGSGNSVTLQGANRGKNVDMMYDDLMERMDAAGATDYFKEVLGQ